MLPLQLYRPSRKPQTLYMTPVRVFKVLTSKDYKLFSEIILQQENSNAKLLKKNSILNFFTAKFVIKFNTLVEHFIFLLLTLYMHFPAPKQVSLYKTNHDMKVLEWISSVLPLSRIWKRPDAQTKASSKQKYVISKEQKWQENK